MFLSGPLSIRKPCIILCISLDCSPALRNFCGELLSQINCLGKRVSVSLLFVVAK